MYRLKCVRISFTSQLPRFEQLQRFNQAGDFGRGGEEVSQEAVQEVLGGIIYGNGVIDSLEERQFLRLFAISNSNSLHIR